MAEERIEKRSAGNGDLFSSLIAQYKGYLMAVILPIVRDPDQAQDVLQETFWQVYQSLPGYRGGNLKTWLARIATHKAVDWCRRRERRRAEFSVASPVEWGGAVAGSAEDEFFREASRSRLAALVNSLPPPYRQTLISYLFEGKSYRELAREAGVTVKTVESRLYRARQILKEQLKEGL
ncbi:MAG: RNA polymerase sigma factor [Firmicutes bacterium]|nr:RNA polymerase sigma factor [Bacillota bacterium]